MMMFAKEHDRTNEGDLERSMRMEYVLNIYGKHDQQCWK